MRYTTVSIILALIVALSGCGGKPKVYPVSGKVTLKGKPYERLIIYFRPLSGEVTQWNMAVAETDKNGEFKSILVADGNGLQAGEYKVSFSVIQTASGKSISSSDKPDDGGATVVMKELVAKPYDSTSEDTPVRFTVKPTGENVFTFDIPTSTK
ncbi:MAG: hypothetical protein ACRC8S_11090 [Fimbriiglobus sp.]